MRKDNDMKSVVNVLLGLACAVMLYTMISSPSPEDVKKAREEGFDAGYAKALEEEIEPLIDAAFFKGQVDGLSDAYDIVLDNSDFEYFVGGILEEAKSFATEDVDDISFWDAMDIVSVYLNGKDPNGYPLPTKKEFEDAVDVLLRYSMFLEWNEKSYSDIVDDYDPFAW